MAYAIMYVSLYCILMGFTAFWNFWNKTILFMSEGMFLMMWLVLISSRFSKDSSREFQETTRACMDSIKYLWKVILWINWISVKCLFYDINIHGEINIV